MADLNNLLGELDDRDEPYLSDGPGGADELSGDDGGGYAGDSDGGRRAELPAALAEAERIKATAALRRDEDGPGYGDGDAAGPGAGTRPGDGTDEGADAEYERLKSLWSQEVMCPELLPNDPDTVALHAELLQGQEDTIEELKERAAAGLGIGGGADEPMLASLAASIYKMEADRVRFLLADLTRTRLAKIENHALYNRELVDRMSDEEINYLKQYGGLIEHHFQRTVLNHLPKDAWKKLNEPEMIEEPDLDAYVFCRVLEAVEIDSALGDKKGGGADDDDEDEMGDTVQEHAAGSCLIARYATVREHVFDGKITLLL